MKKNNTLTEFIIAFCVTTTGILFLMVILGCLYTPETRFGYDALLVPPLFGLLTSLTGFITKSRRDLSSGQMAFRMVLQLLAVECIVFGVNHLAGNRYSVGMYFALAAAIAAVFVGVHFILWLNDRRAASQFNEALERFQSRAEEDADR